MIRALRFIGSVGCFDTFQGSPTTTLAPLTLIYAENGRGKTTITAILRSLATNDPRWIKGRRRIGAHHAPHVVIDVGGAARSLVFQNGAWNANHDSILIFDDYFVDCQREVGRIRDQYDFWRALTALPDLQIDVDALSRAWKAARDAVVEALGQKKSAILEPRSLRDDARSAIELFQGTTARIQDLIESLVASNDALTSLKESTAATDAGSVAEELRRAQAAKERYSPEIAPVCDAYKAARAAKKQAEKDKKEAREALDQHRLQAFPAYKARANHYLQRFGAGFRLGNVEPLDKAALEGEAQLLLGRRPEEAHLRKNLMPELVRGVPEHPQDDALEVAGVKA